MEDDQLVNFLFLLIIDWQNDKKINKGFMTKIVRIFLVIGDDLLYGKKTIFKL